MRVSIRHRPRVPPSEAGAPNGLPRLVELVGETTDWRNGIRMLPEGDGCFVATLEIPPGIYQYKLLVDGHWTLDADNPRTRAEAGRRNNVLVVDGAPEPHLFAATSPWVEELDDGGIRVLVGVRKPHASAPLFHATENGGATWSRAPLAAAFEEDEHAFFQAVVPTSAARVGFRLGTYETSWTRSKAAKLPDWWRRAILYTIFVDRFRALEERPLWEHDPGAHRAAGGHLEGIRRSLDELSELGVDTLYLTPVHVGASLHRYDMVDPLRVDPLLGGEDAYRALVADCRARGMRVVQDVSFSHAGRGFPAFEDVLRTGRASRFASWFRWSGDALVHYGKRTDAPLLDLDDDEVQDLALRSVEEWARRGVSGLRLDMVAEIPLSLGKRIRARFRALVPDGVVFGEVVPQHAWRFRQEGVLDASTDFAFHEILTRWICRPQAVASESIAQILRSELLRGGDVRTRSVRFASTHDHPRLATLAAASGALDRLPLAYALLATLPGVPMLLYGEELGMRSDGATSDPEDVWLDRAPMPLRWSRDQKALRHVVRGLFAARAASPALRAGTLRVLHSDATTAVFRREADGDVVDVAMNFGTERTVLLLEDDEHPRAAPLFTTAADTDGDEVRLGPFGVALLRRKGAPLAARVRRNLALMDDEMKLARTRADSRPSRFFLSITERCNLRCEHCITHAPKRTRDGTARTMSPAVLDALRGDLRLGTYFGFVHGGESLTAPILFDVLDAIGRAREDAPYVAHVLTNGVLFDAGAAERLTRAGVTSVSVSLDGASEATNDAIRTGGRFARIVQNIQDVTAWRAARRADLRLGLSLVVLEQNVHELDEFVDLAARLGVDWIKLEEAVPATSFAKRSLVAPDSAEIQALVASACERARDRGLTAVDHTVERTIWRCRLDDPTRRFLEADEFANRCQTHPCRAPWETVCIEPNGDARLLDFFGPVLGNVTTTPLVELWNGRAAALARQRVQRTRLCGPEGPVTCL